MNPLNEDVVIDFSGWHIALAGVVVVAFLALFAIAIEISLRSYVNKRIDDIFLPITKDGIEIIMGDVKRYSPSGGKD